MVALEKLDKDAEKMNRSNDPIDKSLVINTVIGAAEDAAEHNIYNLDLKLDNIMVDDSRKSSKGNWKVIDWDMAVAGDLKRHKGAIGTEGYMPPEMIAYLLNENTHVNWTIDRAVVWTIGMLVFYLMIGEYAGKVTTEMKVYSKRVLRTPVKSQSDPIWYWVYLMLAYSKNEDIPGKLFPEEIRKDDDIKDVIDWFEHVLCKEDDRWTLQELLAKSKF
ncbi:protein kinase-like protein [Penicillium alfredii]|uniref:Protein kinase-like protein n=1 Tax=Penicillium alfredii TaxID=1506179 RepID=A0A9W9FKW2_9EURO|nr:protein kinase-like protein [Penicillium alfredii]KAJ5102040.1 protein kinase-like protein [Penicillium alfredii]